MKIYGTKNKLPFSWLIRTGLNQNSSHIIFVFDDCLTVHSNPLGIHIDWFKTFKSHNSLNWGISVETNKEQDKYIISHIMDNHDSDAYDWAAFFYFTWRAFLKIVFKSPIPSYNKWGSSNASLCVALPSKTPKLFLGRLKESHIEMISPDELKTVIIKELEQNGYSVKEIDLK